MRSYCLRGKDGSPCRDAGQCWGCFCFLHRPEFNRMWGGYGTTPPSLELVDYWEAKLGVKIGITTHTPDIIEQAGNALRAAGRIIKAVVGGKKVRVSKDEQQRRLTICQGCDRFVNGKCLDCGCVGRWKSWLATERCPLGKWEDPCHWRHLIYHVYPLKSGQSAWEWNLDQLRSRWHLFNGRRVVAVAVDRDTCSLRTVQDYLGKSDVEWLCLANDPQLGEVTSHDLLMDAIRTIQPGHAVFRAHAKGVSKPDSRGDRLWAQTMYEVCLDYLPLVREELKSHPMVGAFGTSDHFPGTFWWFRADQVFSQPYQAPSPHFFGVEYWPGKLYQNLRGLFPSGGHLYQDQVWDEKVLPDLERWKRDNEKHRNP